MDDCISREEAMDCLTGSVPNTVDECISRTLRRLRNVPAAEVKPVARGEWKQVDEDTWECSNCELLWTLNDGNPHDNNMNFCPNCGADMRGGPKPQ